MFAITNKQDIMRKFFLTVVTLAATLGLTTAQVHNHNHPQTRNCAAHDYNAAMMAADPSFQNAQDAIENHTANYIAQNGYGASKDVVTIPVVFHIVWRTASENISDAQILSQLNILNADFALANADAASIPGAFQPLAANTNIQFCLAQRDPNGNPSTGIVRRQTTVTSFSTNNAVKFTAQGGSDAWPRDKYLNVWVCSLGGGLLGYAQFPGGSASTDGVVNLNTATGSIGTATAPFNKGRTLTHEVGHWLNLRHIWGDATCGNDQVNDTPTQTTSNTGCPSFPKTSNCSGNGANGDMFMNYMDYTNDACMFMFSAGQSARMNAVLDAGGFRNILRQSDGCVPVGQVACGVPSGLGSSNITQTSATVSWGAVNGATSYNVQYRVVGASAWVGPLSATSTSVSISGLTAATNYEFQVRANCANGSSAFSASGTFTTQQVQQACGVPTGLVTSNIAQSSATLNWAAVGGATSYNVRLRIVGATSWITTNTPNTTANATGLTAGANYEWQIQAVCGTATSAFTASALFTTTNPTTCNDVYESNNTRSTARAVSVNTDIFARISSTTDQDWFRFTNSSSARNIRVNLDQLPADYDMRLVSNGGSQLAISQNTGTIAEQITRNNATVSTYFVQVYGYQGANAAACYRLRINTSSSAFARTTSEDGFADGEELELEAVDQLSIFPNPAKGLAQITYLTAEEGEATVVLFDVAGRAISTNNYNTQMGENNWKLELGNIPSGMYYVTVKSGTQQLVKKLVVE